MRLTLEDLVKQDCPDWKQQGRRLWCRCVFHSEHTPSLTVDIEKQLYYCFGCEAGGDVLEWCRRARGMSFRDAYQLVHGELPPDRREPPPPDPARARQERFERWRSERYLDAVEAVVRAQQHCAMLVQLAEAEWVGEDLRRTAKAELWQEKRWLKYFEDECARYDPNPLADHTWAWERWRREQEAGGDDAQ